MRRDRRNSIQEYFQPLLFAPHKTILFPTLVQVISLGGAVITQWWSTYFWMQKILKSICGFSSISSILPHIKMSFWEGGRPSQRVKGLSLCPIHHWSLEYDAIDSHAHCMLYLFRQHSMGKSPLSDF